MWSTGMDGERLHAAWRSHLDVACDACDTRLTEGELTTLLDLPEGAEPSEPRLQRLAQGYCPKPGCAARFYRITLAPAEGLDWKALLDQAEKPPEPEASSVTAAKKHPSSLLANRKVRIALAIVALLAAFLFRQWYVNGTIPFVTRTFKVAPADAAPQFGSDAAPLPEEPRTNTFRIAR